MSLEQELCVPRAGTERPQGRSCTSHEGLGVSPVSHPWGHPRAHLGTMLCPRVPMPMPKRAQGLCRAPRPSDGALGVVSQCRWRAGLGTPGRAGQVGAETGPWL